ncbi:eCIS core domain-containing protein [Portibacter lacus]|uniref:eCIS core domain-containing protein n=1 Tax=Portibacter lacus TaxID=1099794 RepID=A0AA37WEB3_9BACT|nr:DUF4157 domain-containing protein [Portibacter lacus]GLR17007.1 hypothetical protein GCM10007940_16220 [Portibacter lacus]
MEKTSDRDVLSSLQSNANSVSFEAANVALNPPALQLKAENSEKEENTVEQQVQPFQFAAEGSGPPSDDSSGSEGNDEPFTPNNTGLPTQLKSGIESLSGYSLDDVNVHYNSDKPAQLKAHAYAQGTDIHLASGQEKHLPHEAWHVVQQKQGRVQPTTQKKGIGVNDDSSLEKEADVMGAKASESKTKYSARSLTHTNLKTSNSLSQLKIIQKQDWDLTEFNSKQDQKKSKFNSFVKGASDKIGGKAAKKFGSVSSKIQQLKDGLETQDLRLIVNSLESLLNQFNTGSPPYIYISQRLGEFSDDPEQALANMIEHHKVKASTAPPPSSAASSSSSTSSNPTSESKSTTTVDKGKDVKEEINTGESWEADKINEMRSYIISAKDAYQNGQYEEAHSLLSSQDYAANFGFNIIGISQSGRNYIWYNSLQELINKSMSKVMKAMAFENKIKLPFVIPMNMQEDDENRKSQFYEIPELAKLIIPVYLEEWMHMFQRRLREHHKLGSLSSRKSFWSENTATFQDLTKSDYKDAQSADIAMNYNEIDILSQFHDWGFPVFELGTIKEPGNNYYKGREQFWNWLSTDNKEDEGEMEGEHYHTTSTEDDSASEIIQEKSINAPGTPPFQLKEKNNTGLPTQLKSGIESLSGYSLDDVHVHYNSDKPAQLKAHAYAQGTDIHLASGQEKHLPHEAWHVVQQKQGRVKPTAQLKAYNINDDSGLEKEADVMGAKAMQMKTIKETTQSQKTFQNKNVSQLKTIQLKSESVSITGVTHLVKLDEGRTSLFEGEYSTVLKSGDLVTIDTSKKLKSRRGPNQEDDSLRDEDRDGEHIYKYFKAEKVNGKVLEDDDMYLRDETFLKSDSENNYNAAHDTLTEKLSDYKNLKVKVKEIINKISSNIFISNAEEDQGDLQAEVDKAGPAINDIKGKLDETDPKTSDEIDSSTSSIIDLLKNIAENLEKYAYSAKNTGDTGLGMNIINIAQETHALFVKEQSARSVPTGIEHSTGKDLAGDILGAEDVYQTTVGLAGGIVGAPGVLATGSVAASVTTGVSYFLGPVGILFGAIGVFLGIKAIYRGYKSEKALANLLPTLETEKIKTIARFAKEKKRKKKLGGAITAIAGGAAIAGGILGIVALSITTLGIGAAILGIGAALIGLGIVIGKIVQHFKKRAAWRHKMADAVKGAVGQGETGAFPQHLMDLGAAAIAAKDNDADEGAANKALEDACVEMAESRRELLSQEAVHFYFDGNPKEKYEALLVIEALNITKEKIERIEKRKGRKGAVSLVSKKMKSW